MPDYKWVGHKLLERQQAAWDFGDKLRVTVPFTGPFSVCLTSRPARGSKLPGFDHAAYKLTVESAKVTELEGGAGRLEVILEATLPDGDVTSEPIGEPVLTVDWAEDRRKLETHPKCGSLSAAATKKGLTWEDWPELDANPDYYVETGEGWTHIHYIEMKRRGVEEYVVFTPKVTRTTFHYKKPTDLGEGCNQRQNPPVGSIASLADYEWLGGPDRFVKTGRKYERTTEWWGAEQLDPTLYPG